MENEVDPNDAFNQRISSAKIHQSSEWRRCRQTASQNYLVAA